MKIAPLAASCLLALLPTAVPAADSGPAASTPPVIERAPEGDHAVSADEVAALRAENKRLAAEAAAAQKRVDETNARLTTLTVGGEKLLQDKTAAETKLAAAQAATAGLQEKLAAADKAASQPPPDLSAKLADTEQKLSDALHRQSVLEADNQLLKTASADQVRLTAEMEKMRQEKATRNASEAASGDARSKLAETESKLATVLRSYSLLQAENDQLKAAGKDRTAATAELDALRRDKAELEAKLAAAPADKSAEVSARLAETENKLATTVRSFSQLQSENEQLKATAANTAALQAEVETLRRDNTALEAKVGAAAPAPQIAAAPETSARLAETEDKLNTVLRSYSLIQAENDRLKAQLAHDVDTAQASSARAAGESAAQISALFDELRQTQAQLTSQAAENSELKTRLALAGSPPGSLRPSPARPGSAEAQAARIITPPAPVAPAARTHVVVEGDTLTKLSRTYYGTTSRWDEILHANSDVIKDENVLPLGATLKIP
jgi:LysM repeat protein